mgnify:FL=1
MAKSKKVWAVDNGFEEIAWESPLEPGVFHMPANTVETKPPKFDPSKKICQWDGAKWVVTDIPKVAGNTLEQPPLPEKPATPEPPPAENHVHEEPEEIEKPVIDYRYKREGEYGQPWQQIEFITENGLEAWQARVAEIKKKYPKE